MSDYTWRGGAGGAPILSRPIADINQYPFGSSRTVTFWQFVSYTHMRENIATRHHQQDIFA